MLVSWKIAGSWNFHTSDIGGNAFVVEKTAVVEEVRQAGDYGEGDFIYATNNYFTDEGCAAILGEEFIEHGGWSSYSDITMHSVRRNVTMYNMFHNYQGEVDLDFAKMLWRFTGKAPEDPFDLEAYRATEAECWETIGHLDNARVSIGLPDDGDEGVMYLCTGPAGRVVYPLRAGAVDNRADWYQIAGTHSFYELTLASGPAKVVSAAKYAAHDYIAEAYQELMWLNYGDIGFEGLNELYTLANTEYYQGVNWSNKAALADGDEALAYYAQAATAFTRAQAHALQLLHALVPPAVTPKDLGLHPYTYDDGRSK